MNQSALLAKGVPARDPIVQSVRHDHSTANDCSELPWKRVRLLSFLDCVHHLLYRRFQLQEPWQLRAATGSQRRFDKAWVNDRDVNTARFQIKAKTFKHC